MVDKQTLKWGYMCNLQKEECGNLEQNKKYQSLITVESDQWLLTYQHVWCVPMALQHDAHSIITAFVLTDLLSKKLAI